MIKRPKTLYQVLVSLLLLSALGACSDEPKEAPRQTVAKQEPVTPKAQTSDTHNYLPALQAEITHTWDELANSAAALHEQTKQLTVSPSAGNLEALLTIWDNTHAQYQATKLYDLLRLGSLPKEKSDGSHYIHSIEIRLDQQPLIPGYLDAVKGYPQSGLIYSEIPLTENSLANEHQLGDTAYVAMGFHALKAILLGDEALNLSVEDRFRLDSGKDSEEIIERRKRYAEVLSQLILKDIQRLQHAWTSPDGHFYNALRILPPEKRDNRITNLPIREKALISKLTQQPDNLINADAIQLRADRVARLEHAFGQLTSTEQAIPAQTRP